MPWGPGAAAAHPRIARVLGPLDAHNAPGPRGKHEASTLRPRDTYLQGERQVTVGDGRCYPPGAQAGGGSGGAEDGRRLCGAVVSSADSGGRAAPPVVLRAAAPPLPRAGRAGGAALRAPRPRLRNTRQPRSFPRAPWCPALLPPRPLRAGSSARLVPARRPRDSVGIQRSVTGQTLPGRDRGPACPVQPRRERWAGKNDCSAPAMEQ